jgi:hypothetical protein
LVVDQQRVAGAQLAGQLAPSTDSGPGRPPPQVLGGDQRFGQPDDAFFVGVPDHQGAVAVGRISRIVLISRPRLEGAGLHDVSASFSRTSGPA